MIGEIYTITITIIPSIALAIWNLFLQINLSNLKEKSQKQIYVHKLQFEKEFQIYEEIWAKIISIRDESYGLRLEFAVTFNGESYDDYITEKIRNVSKLCRELLHITKINEPFYSTEVHKEIFILNKLVQKEAFLASRGPENQPAYWEDGMIFYEKISKPIENIQTAIRKRISNMNADNS